MANQEVIKNLFEGDGQLDRYDKKYLNFFQELQTQTAIEAFTAFRSKDLGAIENTMRQLAVSVTSNMYIIGIGCLIIEREKLYIKAGYASYFEYAQYLFDDDSLPTSTLSDAKIIMEKYLDYYTQLKKAGFRLERNSNKLRYIDEALENHNEDEVFERIVTDTFIKFKEWAQRPYRLIQADLGCLGIEKLHENSRIPKKENKLHKLNKREKAYNKRLARERVVIEHINAKIKTFKSMAYPYRNHCRRHLLRMSLICGIINFELSI